MTDQMWRERAACRLADARMFDPHPAVRGETTPQARQRIRGAVNVCRSCPVIADCLTEARAEYDSGVRGGLYFDHGKPTSMPGFGDKPVPPCGTYRAYRRHVDRVERVDQACADAARDAQHEHHLRRKVRRAS